MKSYQRVVISRFGPPEVLQLQTQSGLPEPGAGQVRIRVQAASVSFTDTMIRTGNYLEVREKPPFTPGYDVVGVVDALGAGVNNWRVGDRVADLTVTGGYSQYVLRPADGLVPVPAQLDAAQAVSLVLSYVTAYQMLHRHAQLQAGQTILVHGGAGAVGMALIQLGRLMGLRVLATASRPKHDFVRSLGAEPIDYRSEDVLSRVQTLTERQGVAAAFDAIDFNSFQRSFRALGKKGSLVAYGVYRITIGTDHPMGSAVLGEVLRFFLAKWWWKLTQPSKSARFYVITGERKKDPEAFRADLSELFRLTQSGQLQPIVDRCLPLAEAQVAHRLVEQARPQGKIVLLMSAIAHRDC